MSVSSLKCIVGGIVAFVALSTVIGSAIEDWQAVPRSTDQVVFAVTTFASVVALQWLVWRFIIPSNSSVPKEMKSFFGRRAGRSFLSGNIAFGYVMIAIYCVELSGYHLRSDPRGHVAFLIMGLVFIAFGVIVRLREAFTALQQPT